MSISVSRPASQPGRRNANFFGRMVGATFVFNETAILRYMSLREAKVMSRGGFMVMDDARKSIRDVGKKGNPAKPGKPPKNRTRQLKDWIDYDFDQQSHDVIVGPKGLSKPASGMRAPKALEFGGRTKGYLPAGTRMDESGNPVFNPRLNREMERTGEGTVLHHGTMHEFTIQPHPYMNPALRKNATKIAKLWATIS